MSKRLALLAAAIILTGCAPVNTGAGMTSVELSVIETAEARATRDALDGIARATSDALALSQQATVQAQSIEATNQAATVKATRQAWALNATMDAGAATSTTVAIQTTRDAENAQATATRIAQDATATATREVATAMAIQRQAEAEATAVMATAQHVEREAQKEAATQALRTFGGWGLLSLALAVALIVGKELLPVIVARLRVIRRKELYSGFPGVDSLKTYNAQASDPLAPVICLVDEATALLADRSVENAIRALVLRARKYGLWCILGGQDWKASSLDTAIRNQLASRFQFKAMSASQSRVLLQRNGAEQLEVAGRALAIIPGREMIELQAPVIGYQDIITATRNSGPRHAMPQVDGEGLGDEQAQRIRELSKQGLSKRQIALEVFGYAGGSAYTAVSAILGGTTTTDDTATDE